MSLHQICQQLATTPVFNAVQHWLTTARQGDALRVKGLAGSLPAFLLAELAASPHLLFCILPTAEAAAFFYSDLTQILPPDRREHVLAFPPTGRKPYDTEQMAEAAPIVERADVLHQLQAGFSGILVSSIPAIFDYVLPSEALTQETHTYTVGQQFALTEMVEQLTTQGFERVDFVEHMGEMAVRGGILDVYPFSGEYPIRFEFFGDEIDSIREFDPRSQRSISRRTALRIVPNIEREDVDQTVSRAPIFEYCPPQTALFLINDAQHGDQMAALFEQAETAFVAQAEDAPDQPKPETRYMTAEVLERAYLGFPQLHIGPFASPQAPETFTFEATPQPSFGQRIAPLRDRLRENAQRDWQTLILCDSLGQEKRLAELLGEDLTTFATQLRVASLHEGFDVPELALAVYTDHQIFGRYHRPTARRDRRRKGGLNVRALQNLQPGDFVVHVDYGIGKFAGLEHIEVRGKQQEAVRVLFRDGDKLYVNINALYKLHKYTGKEGHQPRLTKLGTGEWERTKSRTKKRVKDIARDLIKLYAQRKQSDGFAFSTDSIWQHELEAAFPYEDTPDQAETADHVKRDMEQAIPMDRLVCGDVGFGKTEIAVRAAFKAVQDGKQVAVLVPTTVLAVQHFETFRARLKHYPVNIASLSRFQTSAQQKAIVRSLAEGKTDLVIGTHRLVSKDIHFKNLGLLVIDEEQRFGVAVKEKLRQLRVNVDTLTLTATPIPRTLQFSLMGARDLSIINTPPPNRQPIVTEIHTFDKNLVRDAILYEMNRGGQVFFIHNRVQSIYEIADMLRMLIPNMRAQVAHGQMKPRELEQVMLDFVEHKCDVLISTSIVESGLDIPNANTMIIHNANQFGLADLHQLRGRVGRSDRKAFCYLLVRSIHTLTREAKQRLQAVEEFSDLGSGLNIAMRDLDIRGAGNLLGGEQSGFIAEVGYETYHKILDEAVQELRSEEFQTVFDDQPAPLAVETQIEVEADAFLPETYIVSDLERLNVYRQLSETQNVADLDPLRAELADRFGPLPVEVEHLFLSLQIKLAGQALRLTKVSFKNQRLFLTCPPSEDTTFYETLFHPLLAALAELPHRYVLREDSKTKKLRIIIQTVPDLSTAQALMTRLPTLEPVSPAA